MLKQELLDKYTAKLEKETVEIDLLEWNTIEASLIEIALNIIAMQEREEIAA